MMKFAMIGIFNLHDTPMILAAEYPATFDLINLLTADYSKRGQHLKKRRPTQHTFLLVGN